MASPIYSFNPRDFRRNPVYCRKAPLKGIQEGLQEINRFNSRIERQYSYFTVALIFCVVVSLVLLFCLPVLREIGWFLILCFVLAGIYAGIMRSQSSQWQFPRDRDRLFGDVLKLLQRDMDPQETLEVQLCLGSTTQTGKVLQERPDPSQPSQHLQEWRNPWFGLRGRFLDGNRFSLGLVERVNIATAKPTSGESASAPPTNIDASSGDAASVDIASREHSSEKQQSDVLPRSLRYQGNSSICEGFDLKLKLQVDQDRYGDLTSIAPHLAGAVKLVPGALLIRHSSSEQELNLSLRLPPAFTASLILQSTTLLFLSAYHVLHLAAKLHHPNPALHDGILLPSRFPGALPSSDSYQQRGMG